MSRYLVVGFAATTMFLTLLTGCVSPGPIDSSSLAQAQRDLAQRGPQERMADEGLGALKPKPVSDLGELEIIRDEQTGKRTLRLSLDEALRRALVNNLDIRVVSYDPSIARQEIIEAASEFDYSVFGAASYTKEDKRSASNIFTGGKSETYAFEAGVKQKFTTGAEWSLAWALVRAWDNSGTTDINPYYEPTLVFEISQPLLRNAWEKVNLAGVRKARLNEQLAMAQFRQKVEEVATDVVSIYWRLVQARRELEIATDLLRITEDTLKRVQGRQELDATAVQIKQSEEAVESRRAVFIQSQKNVKDVENRLGRLLADAQINVLDEIEIIPVSVPNSTATNIDVDKRLETALERNPLLEQAGLAIEMANVDVEVAEHQKLPELNLTASAALQELDDSPGDAHDRLFTGNYFGWSAGLSLEYPLGNRLREAELRRSRFERLKAITGLQKFSDEVAERVKERAREVDNSYQQWKVQLAAVDAAKVQLQALEDTEQIRGRLTPEFLQLKLQAQAGLAQAEQAEQKAIIDYNIALVELAQATGTVLGLYPIDAALADEVKESAEPVTDNGASQDMSSQTVILP